jgi:hypothetical protein
VASSQQIDQAANSAGFYRTASIMLLANRSANRKDVRLEREQGTYLIHPQGACQRHSDAMPMTLLGEPANFVEGQPIQESPAVFLPGIQEKDWPIMIADKCPNFFWRGGMGLLPVGISHGDWLTRAIRSF